MRAVAYQNHGRWCADCPRPHCNNAMLLDPGQTTFHCGGADGCLLIADVDWPANMADIEAALVIRPVPGTRNWAPAGHRQANVTGHPEGQTVTDLQDENREFGVI